jgi:hypothetical protein
MAQESIELEGDRFGVVTTDDGRKLVMGVSRTRHDFIDGKIETTVYTHPDPALALAAGFDGVIVDGSAEVRTVAAPAGGEG